MELSQHDIDEIQQQIAGAVTRHGVDRVITQEILEERVRHYLGVAKQELEANGPEESADNTGFQAMATILTAFGGEADLSCAWREGQKRARMHALSETCKTTLAQAVIFRNVYTGANMTKVAKAMELNLPDPRDHQKIRYFEERMWKWIEKHYGRQRLAALPAEMRFDGLVVAGMGPKLRDFGLSSTYEWKDGKLTFQDYPPEAEIRNMLIPRWWQ